MNWSSYYATIIEQDPHDLSRTRVVKQGTPAFVGAAWRLANDRREQGLLNESELNYLDSIWKPYAEAAIDLTQQRSDRNIEPFVHEITEDREDYTGEVKDHVTVDVTYHTGPEHRALYGFDTMDPTSIGLWMD